MERYNRSAANLFMLLLVAALSSATGYSQRSSSNFGSGTAATSGADSGGTDAATANNPAASINQLQLQSWYSPSYIDERGQGNDFYLQPIVSLPGKSIIPSTISRLTVPIASLPNGRTGLGDTTLVSLFFPGYHHQKVKAGFGPVLVFPSATNRYAGSGQWQVGPSFIVVYTGVKKLIIGGLFSNPISVFGERTRPAVNSLTFEPLVTKILPNDFFLRFDPYWNFNWREHGSATLPLLLGVGRLVRYHEQAMNVYVEPEVLARRPLYAGNNPSRVTIKFNLSLIIAPKKKD